MRFAVEAPREIFDLARCVSSGQTFRWSQEPAGSWTGVNGPYWYRVRANSKGYEIESNSDEAEFRRLFRLDWDAHAIRRQVIERGPEIEPYLGQLQGLRLMRSCDPVETFTSFLCTANNNLARITKMVSFLASQGPKIDGTELHRFPDTSVLAAIPPSVLRAEKFGYRADTIPRAVAELDRRGGADYLTSLKVEPYEVAHQELLSIPGIGPKLADCIALFALDHVCAVPVDTHIWKAAVRLYFPQWEGMALTTARYREVSSHFRVRFGDLGGWTQQYLFYDSVIHWRSRLSGEPTWP
jgi:N-glycosylase/DNA lyase